MDKEVKYHKFFIENAILSSKMSLCNRKKVGAILVKDNRILLNAWNGTLSGTDNNCEENGITKDTVMHAEQNLITWAAKEGVKTKDCVMYLTLSPCIICAKLMVQAGIKEVYYLEKYRDVSGIEFLRDLGIKIKHLSFS